MATETTRASHSDEIDLGQLLGALIDGHWWIISITTLAAVIGIVIALLSTPVYRADALIQIEEKGSGMSALTSELGDMFASEGSAVTEIEVLKSRMVIGRTIDELRLTDYAAPNFAPIFGKGLNRLFGSPKVIQLELLGVEDNLVDQALELVVTSPESYELFDPEGNTILTGRVGETLTENGVAILVAQLQAEEGDSFTVKKRHWLEAVGDLQKRLSVSERGKQSGILALSLEGENRQLIERVLDNIAKNYEAQNVAREAAQAEKSLEFLQQQLPEVRDSLTEAEGQLNTYRQSRGSVDLNKEADALLNVIVELESQLNDISFREAEIAQRFTREHPAYRTLLENRAILEAQREELNARIQRLPETQREVLRLSRDLAVNQEVYTLMLNRTQELTVVKAGTVGFVRILDAAKTQLNPVKPKKPLIVVLATLLGGMLSVALVLVRAFMNPGIVSTEGVEDMGLPVYGTVPHSDDETKRATRKVLGGARPLAIMNPADISIEAVRSLRTSIHFAQMDAPNKVVMITGAAPEAGKSFLSANLSVSIAQSGTKVLLIDADLRKGHLHHQFGIKRTEGLTNYLQGSHSIDDVLLRKVDGGIDFIAMGEHAPNPAELLMHQRFADLVAWANEHYDMVIIDTPPILAVTDPAIIGKFAGVSILVGRYAKITLKEIQVARARFEQSGVNLNAFVLNAVIRSRRSSYGYAYYQYNYETDGAKT